MAPRPDESEDDEFPNEDLSIQLMPESFSKPGEKGEWVLQTVHQLEVGPDAAGKAKLQQISESACTMSGFRITRPNAHIWLD
jgi:hypothetical protein